MFQLLSICFGLCFLLVLSISECMCEENDIIYSIVKTANGTVRGQQVVTLFDSKPYHAFKGIPYAEPPVNKLRFKVSQMLLIQNIYIYRAVIYIVSRFWMPHAHVLHATYMYLSN